MAKALAMFTLQLTDHELPVPRHWLQKMKTIAKLLSDLPGTQTVPLRYSLEQFLCYLSLGSSRLTAAETTQGLEVAAYLEDVDAIDKVSLLDLKLTRSLGLYTLGDKIALAKDRCWRVIDFVGSIPAPLKSSVGQSSFDYYGHPYQRGQEPSLSLLFHVSPTIRPDEGHHVLMSLGPEGSHVLGLSYEERKELYAGLTTVHCTVPYQSWHSYAMMTIFPEQWFGFSTMLEEADYDWSGQKREHERKPSPDYRSYQVDFPKNEFGAMLAGLELTTIETCGNLQTKGYVVSHYKKGDDIMYRVVSRNGRFLFAFEDFVLSIHYVDKYKLILFDCPDQMSAYYYEHRLEEAQTRPLTVEDLILLQSLDESDDTDLPSDKCRVYTPNQPDCLIFVLTDPVSLADYRVYDLHFE